MKRYYSRNARNRLKRKAQDGYEANIRSVTLRGIREGMVHGYDEVQNDLIARARDLGIDETQIIQAEVEGFKSLGRRR